MRIIAGMAKGLPLQVPAGQDVRPTTDRIRQAVFSHLGDLVPGATVLDLYAGAGGLGLEAASRGAAAVTLVEMARPALTCLEANLAAFRRGRAVDCAFAVVPGRVESALRGLAAARRQFSLVLADPPYGPVAGELLGNPDLVAVVAAAGVLVLESSRRVPFAVPAAWAVRHESEYGDTRVTYLGRNDGNAQRSTLDVQR
jgi:16S rRNA (guanine966-N2)-methyltransferase